MSSTPSTGAAVVLDGVSFTYPDGRDALRGIDLRIEAGERVAILGPNGAGKTTLALHLNGILRPQAGTVAVDDVTITKATLRAIRQRVALVFQDPDDQLFMTTVGQDVAFGPANAGLRGAALDERVADALETVEMADAIDRAPHHLSYGERRRVAVATVLATDPQVLVLDEPTSNLDPAARRQLADLLGPLALTIVLVTHDLPYALELCPRAVIVRDGVVVADGATRDLLADTELLARNRLELPYGFDPLSVPGPALSAAPRQPPPVRR